MFRHLYWRREEQFLFIIQPILNSKKLTKITAKRSLTVVTFFQIPKALVSVSRSGDLKPLPPTPDAEGVTLRSPNTVRKAIRTVDVGIKTRRINRGSPNQCVHGEVVENSGGLCV